jgi:drug/metabolite transporter (DMT)-like permease
MTRLAAPTLALVRRPVLSATAIGLVAVLVAFVGLSLGSTLAKASGSPGPVIAFWRFLVGAAVWHAIVAGRGLRAGSKRTVGPGAWRAAALPGIAFGVNLSCFFSGVNHTPIAHAEFISALTPLVLIPVAAVTLGERVPRRAVAAGAVALTGVALVLGQTPAGGTSYLGDLLVLGAMGAWVVHLMTARTARARLATTDFMAVMSTAACLTTLVIALATGRGRDLLGLTPRGWLFVVLLAITAGVVSHGLIAWSQRRVAVSTIAMLQLAQPGLGVLWAATFLGESVTPVQLLGMAIVLAAVGAIARASAGQPTVPASSRPRWTLRSSSSS